MSDDRDSLSGKPALLAGEDIEQYSKRRQALENYVKPANIIEEMLVDDVVNKHWEEERLRGFSASVIKAGSRNALRNHLKETGLGEIEASEMVKRYFAGSPKSRQVVLTYLARHGITTEDINAMAMQYKLDPLQIMDQMCTNREGARRIVLKEIKRLLKARERADAPPSIGPNQIPGRSAMASDRQIAAKRANAKRSTGPKTAMGRFKSSRNATRHGLSGSNPFGPTMVGEFDTIVSAITAAEAGSEQVKTATEFALAQIELLRIRSVRTAMMAAINIERMEPKELKRLQALDRYERYALTRRLRAGHKLWCDQKRKVEVGG